MIRAATAGFGWWGQNLVNSVRGSDAIRFTTAHTRTPATVAAFCAGAVHASENPDPRVVTPRPVACLIQPNSFRICWL